MSSVAPESRVLPDADNRLGRELIGSWVATAPAGYVVTVRPPRRTPDQNKIFHAICEDFAKAIPEYGGFRMTVEAWKAVLIVSHAEVTADDAVHLVPDLEGHGLVQIRESSARMSVARGSSLIKYSISEAIKRGVKLRDGEAA